MIRDSWLYLKQHAVNLTLRILRALSFQFYLVLCVEYRQFRFQSSLEVVSMILVFLITAVHAYASYQMHATISSIHSKEAPPPETQIAQESFLMAENSAPPLENESAILNRSNFKLEHELLDPVGVHYQKVIKDPDESVLETKEQREKAERQKKLDQELLE